MNQWKKYLDNNENFQLANYLYKTINDLMKHSLDMGTLLSDDQQKLRAYKEQTKKLFKSRWHEIANALEMLGIIEKCNCTQLKEDSYCEICKGSRYMICSYLTVEEIRDISIFTVNSNPKITDKLQTALNKIIDDLP